jgi:anti-sigma regulatory factor (Ser/Thr protein kinase)
MLPRTVPNEDEPRPGPDPAALAAGMWWTFPALPVHARLARTWLAGWLDAQDPGKQDKAHSALVAFSELASNAVLHGAGPITVHARLDGRRLHCEIADRGAGLPRLLHADPDSEHHRGLSLVDALAADWSVRAFPGGGKTVSFAVELDEG